MLERLRAGRDIADMKTNFPQHPSMQWTETLPQQFHIYLQDYDTICRQERTIPACSVA